MAASACEYATPACPAGSKVVVIVSGLPELWTVSEKFLVAVCCGLLESVTVIETVVVPAAAAVGVPVMTPVDGLIDRLAGNPVADQE